MKVEPRFAPTLLLMAGGFIVWLLHFGAIYGFAGLVCERPAWAAGKVLGYDLLTFGIATLTVAAVIALAIVLASSLAVGRNRPDAIMPPAFPRQLAIGAAALSAVAIAWQGVFAVLFLPACA